MTGEDKKKLDFIFGISKRLTARANALKPENVNYVRFIIGRTAEGLNDFTEATFKDNDDPEKVKILTEIFKELQSKDLIDLQVVKEIIKNAELKIKF